MEKKTKEENCYICNPIKYKIEPLAILPLCKKHEVISPQLLKAIEIIEKMKKEIDEISGDRFYKNPVQEKLRMYNQTLEMGYNQALSDIIKVLEELKK